MPDQADLWTQAIVAELTSYFSLSEDGVIILLDEARDIADKIVERVENRDFSCPYHEFVPPNPNA